MHSTTYELFFRARNVLFIFVKKRFKPIEVKFHLAYVSIFPC